MSWDPFIEIFNPGHRHFVEERNRKRIEAQKPGSAGNPLGVDLDKGVIHIVLPPETGPRPETSSADSTTAEDPTASKDASDPGDENVEGGTS